MMITTLMDTDLYKLTMMQTVLHHFSGAMAEYRFHCRTKGVDLSPLVEEIRMAVASMGDVGFSPRERSYLATLGYFQEDFLDLLRLFRLNPDHVAVTGEGEGGVAIRIRGPWLHTILWEVPLLAVVNELYFRRLTRGAFDFREGHRRLMEKIALVRADQAGNGFRFTDFGTRRRFSKAWQHEVVATLARELPEAFIGTSNPALAMELGLIPVGTMAHEFLQAGQALGPHLAESQKFALESWVREYRGKLGIALSDVCGFNAFLRDFDGYFARVYDGVRHDSGDPVAWGERMIAHYQGLGIDPAGKTLVFSDGLNIASALELHHRFQGRARTLFGIGTHLTNDLGPAPLQIVIKLTRMNGQPVAKISDSPGKTMCDDPVFLRYLAQAFGVEERR